jgi:hypothetical protein
MPNSSTLAFGGGGANTTGSDNVANGTNALLSNTTGFDNIANGSDALRSNTTGKGNIANGTNALNSNTTGSNNIANGFNALLSNTTGGTNVANGVNALFANTTGSNNVANGSNALNSNTTGSNNIANGTSALSSNTTGRNNIANGNNALLSNKTGESNIANGTNALRSNTTGSNNIANGTSALRSNTTGSNNIANGTSALYNSVLSDTLTGSNNIALGPNTADNIRAAAAGNVAIGNAVDLPTNNGSNQGVYQNVLFFTGASGTGTTIAAASKAGIKTNAPNRDLEVAGEVRITDLTTDAPTRLVGADADGDLGQVTLGAGLSLASSSLLADTSFLVTRFDTASMLTNYLRTGVAASTYQAKLNGTGFVKASGTTISYDNSTYLTTGTAASTYLPLTGGTLTGALNGTTGAFSTRLGVGGFVGTPTLFTSGSGDQEIHFTHSDNIPGRKVSLRLTNNNSVFYTFGGLIYALEGEGLNQYSRMSFGVNTTEIMHLTRFSRVGIMNNSPSYTLDVNGTFRATGASLIGGTFGVTGATTLSAPLTVNSSAVFNESSADSDFRVESDGNADMVFVDASTDRVGIGYASPTKTLDVNGEVRINTVTATPTSLLGKDGSNVVGEVTLGNSLTLSSGTLSVNNKITDINTSEYTILANDLYIDNFNNSSTTIILPLAELNTFRELKFKNSSTGSLIANDNIIPLNGSGTTTTILPATNAKWCTLVSDGGFWRIMQSN